MSTPINWSDSTAKVSEYFTVKECLWLPQWSRMASEADGLDSTIKSNIARTCSRMDVVREALQAPITVHCFYRPEAYNKLVGGASNSSHLHGLACDFHVAKMSCDAARALILKLNLLEHFEMRMEDLEGANWIHLDIRPVAPGGHRYFKP